MVGCAPTDLLRQRRQAAARALAAARKLGEALDELDDRDRASGRAFAPSGLPATWSSWEGELGPSTSQAAVVARALRISQRRSLACLVEGLTAEVNSLTTKGRPRNNAAHLVARVAAEMYLAATGVMPTYWTGAPGPYARLLEVIFAGLGIEGVDARRPAEAAIRDLGKSRPK